MEILTTVLPWIQIILAIVLTIAILMQQRGAGIGGAFGGSDSAIHYERRGSEKTLFNATIWIAVIFVLSTFIQLVITQQTSPDYVPPVEEGTEQITPGIEDITVESDTVEISDVTTETQPVEATQPFIPTQLDALLEGGSDQ